MDQEENLLQLLQKCTSSTFSRYLQFFLKYNSNIKKNYQRHNQPHQHLPSSCNTFFPQRIVTLVISINIKINISISIKLISIFVLLVVARSYNSSLPTSPKTSSIIDQHENQPQSHLPRKCNSSFPQSPVTSNIYQHQHQFQNQPQSHLPSSCKTCEQRSPSSHHLPSWSHRSRSYGPLWVHN